MPLARKNHSNHQNHYKRKSIRLKPRKRRQTASYNPLPIKYSCSVCGIEHSYLCDCGCHHESHPFGQGCKFHPECERYSQKHQRVVGETDEQFNERILSPRSRR